MYVAIFVDPRYVAAFLTLFCLGMLVGFPVPADAGHKIAQLIVVATIMVVLYPVLHHIYSGYAPRLNVSLEAAQALEKLGIQAGDRVARISPSVSDYALERILRVQIVAEVDREHIGDFWSSPFATQQSLLSKFASRGVKAVIATSQYSVRKIMRSGVVWAQPNTGSGVRPADPAIALSAVGPPASAPDSRPIPTTASACWRCRSYLND
jgi:hypothetical protein